MFTINNICTFSPADVSHSRVPSSGMRVHELQRALSFFMQQNTKRVLSRKGLDKRTILFPVFGFDLGRALLYLRVLSFCTYAYTVLSHTNRDSLISSWFLFFFFFKNTSLSVHIINNESLFPHADPDLLFSSGQNLAAASDRRPGLKDGTDVSEGSGRVLVCSCSEPYFRS